MYKYMIGCCIACLAVILIMVIAGVLGESKEGKSSNLSPSAKPSAGPIRGPKDTLIGVVKEIDKQAGIFTLLITDTGVEQMFTYDGTTSFTSRYDQPITAGEVSFGEIVEVTFDKNNSKLETCDITEKAWEYKGISKWVMDKTNKTIRIGSKTYQYTDLLYAFDSTGEIDTNRLSSKNEVTIKGIDGQVFSILVTKGHGYLTLTGQEAFLEGTIEVGYDIITTVTEDMVLTLREGDYKVTITKNGLSATKYIKIRSGEDYTLDFSEYKPEKVQTGKCYFDVTPAGSDLFIDNVQTDYNNPIELEYGTYDIRVECAGYKTYYAKLVVANEKEVLTITLVDEDVATTPSPQDPEEDTEPSTSPTPTRTPVPAEDDVDSTATPSSSPAVSTTNKIQITSPAGAFVYLNDTYKGTIPVSFQKVIGEDMRLTLLMTGKDSKTYNVTVKDDGFDVVWSFDQWWQ